MSELDSGKKHWDRVARGWVRHGYHNELLAEHKRKTHLALVARWADAAGAGSILKTDLFEEATGPDQFLFDLSRVNGNVIGTDCSSEVVLQARTQARSIGVDAGWYVCCDVRRLPFRGNTIGLVISGSTLDHFPREDDIIVALKELARVLRPGGTLILTMDNPRNLTYPPYPVIRLWMRLGLTPYFVGRTLPAGRLKDVLEGIGLEVEDSTAVFHYPHPDMVVRWLERTLRRISGGRLDGAIRRGLTLLDGLEGRRCRYLTGRYVAVKAVKKDGHSLDR